MLLTSSDVRISWLLVRSKPRLEGLALETLSARGFETYCPRILERPTHRHAPTGPVPLFPGYLFCRGILLEHFHAVTFAHGVSGFVRFGERFAALSDEEVEALRSREEGRGYLVPRDIRVAPTKGSRVRVVEGAFKGYEGLVMDYCSAKERVKLLLLLVTGSLRVQVPTEQVRVA
jgi:transcription antitermination factor NusG